jgi:hypothetical protein
MAYTTIDDPSAYFKVQLYTGDGNASKAITFDDTDTNMQPDFVWIKRRDDADSHFIYDSVRFDGSNAYWLQANNTNAQGSDRPLTAFGSDGFTIGSNNSALNGNTNTYVAWNWKAGGSASSNSNGDITSSVSASTTAGFSIVSYTGNGSNNQTVGHGLSVAPAVMIFKNRDDTNNWAVYHHKNTSAPATDYLSLSTTAATADDSSLFNDTAPTSSVFTIGSASDTGSGSGGNNEKLIAYCLNEVKGYSKFGSYTGNGNADGAFVYTGFRPAWVMRKRTDSTNNWGMNDNKRNTFNITEELLLANSNNAASDGTGIDMLSNGFKMRSNSSLHNASGGTYIYMAFAESPFVNSNGVPTNAR